jgi:hypothetical protein
MWTRISLKYVKQEFRAYAIFQYAVPSVCLFEIEGPFGGGGGVRACPCPAQGRLDPSASIQAVQCRVRVTSDASVRPNILRCRVVLEITIGCWGRQLNSIINIIKLYNSWVFFVAENVESDSSHMTGLVMENFREVEQLRMI